MSSSWRWIDPKGAELIEVKIPSGGVALAVIPPRSPGQPEQCAAKITTFNAQEVSKANQSEGSAWLASGLASCDIEMRSGTEVRLLGEPKAIANLTSACLNSGIPLGKPVPLSSPFPPVQFMPREGRLRIPRETSVAEAVTRVLIVDDSKTIRDLLTKVISQDPKLVCVGTVDMPTAADEAIARLKPDVVTLDIHMPEMNGVELLKLLMPKYHLPTVMISSLSMEDGTFVLDALDAGAVDYIQKPSANELSVIAPLICEKIRHAATAKVQSAEKKRAAPSIKARGGAVDNSRLIVIGSSTGGTEALKQVLTSMPAEIPATLIVQHIPAVFSKAFADRMNSLCPFEVKEAEDGDEVLPNRVLIAAGGKQMRVTLTSSGVLKVVVDDTAPVNRHKPSVDALFDSVAVLKNRKITAAILTGMGADGAKGLLALKKIGAATMAQDEATCVVYGMPKEAVKLGAADRVLPIGEIAQGLMSLIGSTGSR